MGEITAPAPITAAHDIVSFSCGATTLDHWLQHHALKNEISGASRTFVICEEQRVIGYYTLAVGSIEHQDAPGKIRRNMPNPVPVMVLGRLAIDQQWRRSGLGQGLLKDALLRTLAVSKQAGIRALLVHALSEDAKSFYTQNGFIASPLDAMTLMVSLKDAEHNL